MIGQYLATSHRCSLPRQSLSIACSAPLRFGSNIYLLGTDVLPTIVVLTISTVRPRVSWSVPSSEVSLLLSSDSKLLLKGRGRLYGAPRHALTMRVFGGIASAERGSGRLRGPQEHSCAAHTPIGTHQPLLRRIGLHLCCVVEGTKQQNG